MLQGVDAHSDAANPNTTAFHNIVALIRGQEVFTYAEPEYRQEYVEYPYQDPDFQGPTREVP